MLPVVFKIFEKIITQQLKNFMGPLLSKYQCEFKQGFSAQNCLLAMLEKWESSVDKGKVFSALLLIFQKLLIVFPMNWSL